MQPQSIPDQPTLIPPSTQITQTPKNVFVQPEHQKIAEIEPDVSSSIQRDIVHYATANIVSTANTLRKRNTFRFKTIASADTLSLKEPVSASSSSSGTVATRSKPIISKHTTRKYAKETRAISNRINRNHRGGSVKKRVVKSVVFNGTFPIDEPMSSRFEIYSNSDSGSVIDDEDDFDDEAREHIDESLSDEPPDRSMSIQQLVSYKSRHSEYEKSFSDFDKFIENRRKMYQQN